MRKREVARLLDLLEQLALKPEPSAVAIIRETMKGFKQVMNPDIENSVAIGPDIYSQEPPKKDPAFDLDPVFPDSYLEAQERELLEGA